jgi:hypothetical protein
MRKFLSVILCFIVFVCGSISAQDRIPLVGQCEKSCTTKDGVALSCTSQVAAGLAQPTPAEALWKKDTSARVADVCDLMEKAGFKTINAVPCGDEDAYIDERSIPFGSDVYSWKAIMYKSRSGVVEPRVAVRTLTKGGVAATRLEELKLVLNGYIPLGVNAAGWLPPKRQGVALEFGYGKLGANAKVEVVDTLPNGDVIKHVTQDGFASYVAIETTKVIMKKEMELRTVTVGDTLELARQTAVLPTEQELKNRGIIDSEARLVRVLATNVVEIADQKFEEKVIAVEKDVKTTVTSTVTYPYAD